MNTVSATIQLECGQISAIVLSALKGDYENAMSYSKGDLDYDKKLIKSLKRVLEYYMVYPDYLKYIHDVKKCK